MMRPFLLSLLCALLLAACQTAPAEPDTRPLPFSGDPWPEIRKTRIETLLPSAMDRAGVDAWVVICRENANDPMARHIGGENAGGTAAFMFFREPDGVHSIALSPQGEYTALSEMGLLDEVVPVERYAPVWDQVADRLRARDPQVIAVNMGGSPIADGLSHTQYVSLTDALGPTLTDRLTSAEPLIVEWLSVKTPEEVEIMRRAAALTAQWQVEAYAEVVPGTTADADVAAFLKARMAEHGVTDGWAPDQNPNVNSGLDRGHSHATDRVIRPGDFIQTDFGIKVHDQWVTDIQRFAYVLAPGETEAPPEALARWEAAKRGNRAAFAAMKPGASGYEVDRAQRRQMRADSSLPVMWSTGHPVGYWAHDVGPSLGGGQEGRTPSARQQRTLRPGMTFAFDGFHSWAATDGAQAGTKTISVEEMVVITEDGAEWLVPPQEALILIPSQ